jgi:hypothetical protein
MLSNIIIPLQVLGIGIVISYGIAVLIKVLMDCIQHFNKDNKRFS